MSILAFVATVSFAETGEACSCGGTWTRADADVVFQGEAVDVHEPLHLKLGSGTHGGLAGIAWGVSFTVTRAFGDEVRTVFHVKRAWKGAPSEFVTVNTGSGVCCDCSVGNVFDEGSDYIVYATRSDGELRVGFCGGDAVAPALMPPAELAKLGPGAPPSVGSTVFPMSWRHLLLPAAGAVPFALAGAIGWFLSRRGRRTR
jgi:hypothetical protein